MALTPAKCEEEEGREVSLRRRRRRGRKPLRRWRKE